MDGVLILRGHDTDSLRRFEKGKFFKMLSIRNT